MRLGQFAGASDPGRRRRRNEDSYVIDPPLNPSHPSPAPGPNLRGYVIHDLEPACLGHPREMEIQTGIVD